MVKKGHFWIHRNKIYKKQLSKAKKHNTTQILQAYC